MQWLAHTLSLPCSSSTSLGLTFSCLSFRGKADFTHCLLHFLCPRLFHQRFLIQKQRESSYLKSADLVYPWFQENTVCRFEVPLWFSTSIGWEHQPQPHKRCTVFLEVWLDVLERLLESADLKYPYGFENNFCRFEVPLWFSTSIGWEHQPQPHKRCTVFLEVWLDVLERLLESADLKYPYGFENNFCRFEVPLWFSTSISWEHQPQPHKRCTVFLEVWLDEIGWLLESADLK